MAHSQSHNHKKMDYQLGRTAYDLKTGYTVKHAPPKLFNILDKLVSSHLNLQRTIGSYTPSQYQLLVSALNQSNLDSRDSRTLPKRSCRIISKAIIKQLSMIMPTPRRLHNDDIYFRIVVASDKNTISIPHRDEYFHRITPGWEFQKDEESIKVWIPLFCPSGIALGVIPGSHQDYSHGNATYLSDYDPRQFKTPHHASDLTPVRVAVKQCLIFPSMLVHGSLSETAVDPLRISVELSPVLSK